jgi:methionyl-tRNA synthetase
VDVGCRINPFPFRAGRGEIKGPASRWFEGEEAQLSKKFYVTTPIYYVNGVAHIGTATTTLIADAVVRFHRLRGEDCFLLTGTDEHAQKVADAAAVAGQDPQEFVDVISQRFADTWKFLNVQYDRFIRTSDPQHKHVVGEVFKRLQASGDIYKGVYEGWYSVADETFFRDSDVENGRAKETNAVVERVTEENYYFKLSAYGDKLLSYIEANPDFLQPETRRNEVIAFINQGLRDVPVSRRNTGWGIPVPGDSSQSVYVWFDALINYLTITEWPESDSWQSLWPADAHLVGKEIYTRFHATLWPAMLMGLGIALPKHVIGHAWWLIGGEKGAKSKGNIPTPQEATAWIVGASGASEDIAIDALRYYLLRDISFTGDVEFSFENLTIRFNAELANNIGNLLNRSLNMLKQYEHSIIPDAIEATKNGDVAKAALETATIIENEMEAYRPGPALEAIARFADVANKAIGVAEPWKKHKQGDRLGVAAALYTALEANRIISVFLAPFLPTASAAIRQQLGLKTDATWQEARQWGVLTPGSVVEEAAVLFPRIDAQKAALQTAPASPAPIKKESPKVEENQELITINDFAKVQLKVATILSAETVEGAKKLLKLSIEIGEAEPRQLVAGIAEYYTVEELPGKKIVVVANLQPATIRGVQSQGMLLAATNSDGKAILLTPENPNTEAGSKVR